MRDLQGFYVAQRLENFSRKLNNIVVTQGPAFGMIMLIDNIPFQLL